MRLNILIREKQIKLSFLALFFAILVHLMGNFPEIVEKYYSQGFYPLFAFLLRMSTGWLPFSMGDIGYFILSIWIFTFLIRFFWSLYFKIYSYNTLFLFLGKLFRFSCWGYILFQLFWGLNYSRLGIATQLEIAKNGYSKEDVTTLTRALIAKTNEYRLRLKDSGLPIMQINQILKEAFASYNSLSTIYPFLKYKHPTVKMSLFTPIADYIGFAGYYAPFSGEAQLRADLPPILLPYITCHEIAHQLGYASESEANFVGYLAASSSKNDYINYSVYLDLLGYALGEEFIQYAKDSSNFHIYKTITTYNNDHINPMVKKDRLAIRQFFLQRRNDFSPVTANLYNQFLLFNKQLAGMNSYNEVIGWLISYQKKMGKI